MLDLTGHRYGMLTVIECDNERSNGRRKFWICRCDCGIEKSVNSDNLRRKDSPTVSCGCQKARRFKEAYMKHGDASFTKGVAAEYRIWQNMRNRCRRSKDKRYAEYGGRGIKVCDRWTQSYENFLSDMGRRPSPKHSIDRIDVNGHYEPSNCRWATAQEQMNNMSRNVRVAAFGETRTVMEWSRIFGVNRRTISQRLSKGWHPEDAVSKPPYAA